MLGRTRTRRGAGAGRLWRERGARGPAAPAATTARANRTGVARAGATGTARGMATAHRVPDPGARSGLTLPPLQPPGPRPFAGEPTHHVGTDEFGGNAGIVHVADRRRGAEQREQYSGEPFAVGLYIEVFAHLAGEPGGRQIRREEVDAFAQQHRRIFGEQQADRIFVKVLLGGDDPARLRDENGRGAELVLEGAAPVHRLGHLAIEALGSVFGARFDNGGLIAEVLVDGAAGNPGPLGDIDDGGLLETLFAETRERGLDDELAGVGRLWQRGSLGHHGPPTTVSSASSPITPP